MAVKKVTRRARASNQVKKLLEQSYSRVLVPDGGEHYTAEILEFPGCSSTGATPAEAYANLERAAETWLARWLSDGKEAPRPFTSKETSGRFALRLPKSLYVRASQAAARESVSLNLYIANAVAERVGASAAMQAFDGVVNELSKLAPRGAEGGTARRAGAAQAAQAAHSARHRSERIAAAARV
jgi:predicted HicB family RNase H-like nuclease